MNRFNPAFLKMGTSAMVFDKPNEGTPGGEGKSESENITDIEAKKAAEDVAKLAEAEAAESKAREDAEKALAEANTSDDPKIKAYAEEKAELLREVMDKKSKLKEAQAEAKEAREKLALFGDVDPEKVKKLLQAEADAEKASLEAKGEFDRVKEMMASEHSNQMSAKEEELQALRDEDARKAKLIDDLTVGSAFGNSRYISEDLILSPNKARQLYGDRFGVQDGQTVAYDKPRNEKDRIVMVDANGAPLSFDAAMKKIVDADPDKDTIIKTKMSPGSKSKTVTPPAKTGGKKDDLYGASRIAASLRGLGEI